MRVRISAGVATTLTGDGGLALLDQRTGKLFRANNTAAAMWQTLMDNEGRPEITAVLIAAQFGVELDRVQSDLHHLITLLREAELVNIIT